MLSLFKLLKNIIHAFIYDLLYLVKNIKTAHTRVIFSFEIFITQKFVKITKAYKLFIV